MNRDYKDFNRLDPKLFKAFLAAAEWQNFTVAAAKSSMTQSGISQQIAKLEEQIGFSLFSRVNKKIALTDIGKELVRYIDQYLDGMDSFFEYISSEKELAGRVSYCMPNSCLLSPHLGMMLDKREEHPNIELEIDIIPNESVYEKVLEATTNFGFVTEFNKNPALNFVPFCQEEYVLLGAKQFKGKEISPSSLKNLPFVVFPGMESYFNTWLKTFFPKNRSLNFSELNVKASISQLDGVITLLKGGVGITVMPKHCVEKALKSSELYILKKGLLKKEALNHIFMINLKNFTLNRRSKKVFDWFLEMKS